MKDVIAKVMIRAGIAHWLKFKDAQGYSLRLCPSTRHRWRAPEGERQVENFFRRYVKAGDVVIDAGANVGIFTVVCALQAGSTGKVYAIEAHPQTYRYLVRHVVDNGLSSIVRPFNVAIGEKAGEIRFSDDTNRDDVNHVETGNDGISVPLKRMDALVKEPRIDLLKIDVEGYEKPALVGAGSLLNRVQCILIEVEGEKCQHFGYTARELVAMLESNGFTIMRISGDSASFVPDGFAPKQAEDLVAVRDVAEFLKRTGYKLADIPLSTPSFRRPKCAAT